KTRVTDQRLGEGDRVRRAVLAVADSETEPVGEQPGRIRLAARITAGKRQRVGLAATVPGIVLEVAPVRGRGGADAAAVAIRVGRTGARAGGAAERRIAMGRAEEGGDDPRPRRAVADLAVVVAAAVREVNCVVDRSLLQVAEQLRLGTPFGPARIG